MLNQTHFLFKDLLRWLYRVIEMYEDMCSNVKKKPHIEFTARYHDFVITFKEEAKMKLTDIEKVALAIQPLSAAGNPAPVESVAWAVSDPSILSLTPSEDGLSCSVVTTGALGAARVNVTADADLGEGIVTLEGFIDFEIVASQAVNLNIAAGTPESRL